MLSAFLQYSDFAIFVVFIVTLSPEKENKTGDVYFILNDSGHNTCISDIYLCNVTVGTWLCHYAPFTEKIGSRFEEDYRRIWSLE